MTVPIECTEEILCVSNCLDIRYAADMLSLGKLEDSAKAMALDCFEQIVQSDSFTSLPALKLYALLLEDHLNVSSECAMGRQHIV